MISLLFHVASASVVETTYFFWLFMKSAKSSWLEGQ
jgi:hypothetical protein